MKNLTPKHLRCTIGASCPGIALMPGNIVRVTGTGPDGQETWVELGIAYFELLDKIINQDATHPGAASLTGSAAPRSDGDKT